MKNKTAKILSILLLLLAITEINAQTDGALTFKFTSPIHTSGNYRTDGKYLVAVWIESCSPCTTSAGTSTFVKTKLKYGSAGNYDHLATWTGKSGKT